MQPQIIKVQSYSSKKKKRKQPSNLPKINFSHQYKSPQQISYDNDHQENKEEQKKSEGKLRGVDEQTMGQIQDSGLAQPYQYLSQRAPTLMSIFVPRFAIRSITFFLSIFYAIMFIVLIIYNYSQTQTQITWNCSLFKLQVKYFPKLRYENQIWRVITSSFFHSNFAHFFLNIFGMQVYGYFIQWYYGKFKYSITLICSLIFAHFFSSIVQKSTISTTSSSLLFAMISLKCFFFWEYREYRKLRQRKTFLYILIALIVGLNLIPLFVVNNVDYSTALGGLIVGMFFGAAFLAKKNVEGFKSNLIVVLILGCWFGSLIFLIWGCLRMEVDDEYRILGQMIQTRC